MAIFVDNVNIDGGGGGGAIPNTPANVLLDPTAPDTFVTLNSSGVGTSTTAEEASAMLVPPTRTPVPDSGWVDVASGTASASHAGGVQTLSVDSGSSIFSRHAAASVVGIVPEAPEIELIGRLVVTTGAPPSAFWTVLSLGSADDANVVLAQAIETGQVQFWTVVAGAGTLIATSPGTISLTNNESWLRLTVRPAYSAAYYGSGPTTPSSWTLVGDVVTPPALLAGGLLTQIGLRAGRTASGSGSYVAEWRNVEARSLGLVS